MTASIEQEITFPESSTSTFVTMKCFSLLIGFTAVHLLLSSLSGLNLFIDTH